MAIYYVDLSATTNGDGSLATPFRDFASVNGGLWDTNEIRVKRGTSRVVAAAGSTRAEIVAPSGCLVTAYGDAAAPLPVISGGGVNFNPVHIRSGAAITVQQLHITLSAASGLQCSAIAGATLNNITLQDILVTRTNQSNIAGSDGVSIGNLAGIKDGGAVTNVIARRITGRDNNGHGLKVRDRATGVQVLDSTFVRSGLSSPSHGCGTCGSHHVLPTPGTGWSFISGTVYERTIPSDVTGKVTDITEIFGVYVAGAFPYYQLTPSATPLTPGIGECGLNGNNVVRINIGANPSVLTECWVIFAVPKDVAFINCIGANTTDSNGVEGQGVYFDIGSLRCRSYNCAGVDNAGHGAYFNVTNNCSHDGFYSANNGKGAASSGSGRNSRFHNSVLIARPGTNGIDFLTGASGTAMRNQIIGATIGINCSNPTAQTIAEDENVFVSCGTRQFQVNSTGTRSSDRTTIIIGRGNMTAFAARQRLAAAELVR